MIAYTHNDTHKAFYEKAWDILVEHAGASRDPHDKETFVRAYTQIEHQTIEWRFCGLLGFGGKFWRNRGYSGSFYVSCYSEDKTKKLGKLIDKVNALLSALATELKPNPDGP